MMMLQIAFLEYSGGGCYKFRVWAQCTIPLGTYSCFTGTSFNAVENEVFKINDKTYTGCDICFIFFTLDNITIGSNLKVHIKCELCDVIYLKMINTVKNLPKGLEILASKRM